MLPPFSLRAFRRNAPSPVAEGRRGDTHAGKSPAPPRGWPRKWHTASPPLPTVVLTARRFRLHAKMAVLNCLADFRIELHKPFVLHSRFTHTPNARELRGSYLLPLLGTLSAIKLVAILDDPALAIPFRTAIQ